MQKSTSADVRERLRSVGHAFGQRVISPCSISFGFGERNRLPPVGERSPKRQTLEISASFVYLIDSRCPVPASSLPVRRGPPNLMRRSILTCDVILSASRNVPLHHLVRDNSCKRNTVSQPSTTAHHGTWRAFEPQRSKADAGKPKSVPLQSCHRPKPLKFR